MLIEDGKRVIKVLPSTYIETFFNLRDRKFSFKNREFWRQIYNQDFDKLVIIGSRGSEKSTYLANRILLKTRIIPFYKTLYVAPTTLQLQTFVREFIDGIAKNSPFLDANFTQDAYTKIYNKKLKNGSTLFFRYAFYNADRCRGLHIDFLAIDELQDMLPEVIEAILPTLDHAPNPQWVFVGTQKTVSHASYFYWQKSKQIEFVVKCQSCNKWNILQEDNLGPEYLWCSKCHSQIYIQDGRFVSLNPSSDIWGFRIHHLMLPWIPYKLILERKNIMTPESFKNEILALPSEAVDKPITEYHLREICKNYSFYNEPDKIISQLPVYCGIDWGSGIKSYTVLALIVPWSGKFRIIYAKKFIYESEREMKEMIIDILKKFKVRFTVCDWGFGAGYISYFQEIFGDRFVALEYVASSKKVIEWDAKNFRFIAPRTYLMTKLFNDIKRGRIEAPRWEEFKFFAEDILAIYKDFNERLHKITYNHPPNQPDDFAHALIYSLVACNAFRGKWHELTI